MTVASTGRTYTTYLCAVDRGETSECACPPYRQSLTHPLTLCWACHGRRDYGQQKQIATAPSLPTVLLLSSVGHSETAKPLCQYYAMCKECQELERQAKHLTLLLEGQGCKSYASWIYWPTYLQRLLVFACC